MKNREQTEEKILEAVGSIIENQGFEKVGINAIATEAGVSKMLIYRYFGGVEELIAQYLIQKGCIGGNCSRIIRISGNLGIGGKRMDAD